SGSATAYLHRLSCKLKAWLAHERVKQAVKHQVRYGAHIPAILKLAKILREMLPANVNVRPVDAPLQDRPEALNRIDRRASWADIFARRVIDAIMAETALA